MSEPVSISISEIPIYEPRPPLARTVKNELTKDDFLKLLVTRLANQDPLDPSSDTEFIAQLAQFSSLELLNNINETLSSGMGLGEVLSPLSTLGEIRDLLGESAEHNLLLSQTINNTMAASLIDRTVKWQADAIGLTTEGNADVHYWLTDDAKSVIARIYDEEGNLVRAMSTGTEGVGEHKFTWDGKDSDGQRLPTGNYKVEIVAFDDEGDSTTISPYFKGKVDGVQYADGNPYLNIDGLLVPLANVMEISAN